MTRAAVYGINIVIETDQPTLIKSFLEFNVEEKKFNFFDKRMKVMKVHKKIYNRTKKSKHGTQYYEVGLGWAAYILGVLSAYLPLEDTEALRRSIYQDQYRSYGFPELRDYQNDDVLHILKYRFGLCTVQTGYGKTQVISALANYFATDLGQKVLIVTPGTKARDEVVKRIKMNYGIEVSEKLGTGQIQAVITSGFLNQKKLKDPDQEALVAQELATFDVVLSDEVEYCINPAGEYIFEHATNATSRYAFSGTADKGNGNMISFQNGLSDPAVAGNLGLIKFFGPSLVYRKPLDRVVNLLDIRTTSLYKADISCLYDDDANNKYLNVMNALFTCPEVCQDIFEIIKRFKNIFVPINNLQSIIGTWIQNYWIGSLRILLVCGEGYIYYDLDGNKKSLTLQEACEYIKRGDVDVIPSTSSGFRALDFPNLSNILLFSGKIAGSVLQQIGRVARQQEMTIITLSAEGRKSIPIYTKGCQERENMITEYYKYCDIRKTSLNIAEFIMRQWN